MVERLKGQADADRNGIVTADELADYVRRNVREATKAQQNPTAEGGSFDANMSLAYVLSNVKPGAPPPAKFGTNRTWMASMENRPGSSARARR